MTTAQLVNAIIFFLWPSMIGVAIWLFHFLVQRLPSHTRLALEQFAQMAVQQVEQQHSDKDNETKKALAIVAVQELFRKFGLPVPSPEVINIALEAAVYWMKQLSSQPITPQFKTGK